MMVFRLCKSAWKNDLTGRGAELTGGRWNSKGTALIYTSSSRALCMAEVAVHLPLSFLPDDYFLVEISIPDTLFSIAKELKKLPPGWRSFPYDHQTQIIGDRFVHQGRHLLLKVPSAVVQGDFNYLINPRHPKITRIKIVSSERFTFDSRLFNT
jgi:RES domain-containing protein